MAKMCAVCGNKIGLFGSVDARDGKVCSKCSVRFYQVTNKMTTDGFKDKGIFDLTGEQIRTAIEKADRKQERIKRDIDKRKAAFKKQQKESGEAVPLSDSGCDDTPQITTEDENI